MDGLIVKWGVIVVFIAKALGWASRVRVITCAHGAGHNSKRVKRSFQFTTMKQEKRTWDRKARKAASHDATLGRKNTKATRGAAAKV